MKAKLKQGLFNTAIWLVIIAGAIFGLFITPLGFLIDLLMGPKFAEITGTYVAAVILAWGVTGLVLVLNGHNTE